MLCACMYISHVCVDTCMHVCVLAFCMFACVSVVKMVTVSFRVYMYTALLQNGQYMYVCRTFPDWLHQIQYTVDSKIS